MKRLNKRSKIIAAIICIALGISLIALSLWGNYSVQITEITVTSEKLPSQFDGYKIAHVSDLHNAQLGKDNESLLSLIADAEPDIIVITGDLIDSRRLNIDTALDFVKRAAKIAPIYYVNGNHEARISEYKDFEKTLVSENVTVLRNTSVALNKDGGEIRLTGIDDRNFFTGTFYDDDANTFENALGELAGSDYFSMLLSHRPEYFDDYCENGFDLIFSGHAHGGQIRLPRVGGMYAPGQGFFPEYDAGLYTDGDTNMIVSRGLGNSAFPLRVNNRPELVIVTLKIKMS